MILWASVYGRTTDALALTGDEGRGKLRKSAGSGTHTLIRRSPNGETRRSLNWTAPLAEHIGHWGDTGGSETSQYPEESKSTETPLVVASERGSAQTGRLAFRGYGAAIRVVTVTEEQSGKIGHSG